jgi:hypothetical protein
VTENPTDEVGSPFWNGDTIVSGGVGAKRRGDGALAEICFISELKQVVKTLFISENCTYRI